jgi:hypothetical protein
LDFRLQSSPLEDFEFKMKRGFQISGSNQCSQWPMKKSKADPRNPPIEDLEGQVYQHELGDPDRAEQIDRVPRVHRRPQQLPPLCKHASICLSR